MGEETEPVTIDLRALKAQIANEDGDPVLVVSDGGQAVHFELGAGGTAEQAVLGAQRLGDVAFQLAAMAERIAASRRRAVEVDEDDDEAELPEYQWWHSVPIDIEGRPA